jgi:hypothetical protein
MMDLSNLLSNLFGGGNNKPCNCEKCSKRHQKENPPDKSNPLYYPDTYLDGQRIEIQSEKQEPPPENKSPPLLNMNMIQSLLPLLLGNNGNLDLSKILGALGGGNGDNANPNILSSLLGGLFNNNTPSQSSQGQKASSQNFSNFKDVNDYIFD